MTAGVRQAPVPASHWLSWLALGVVIVVLNRYTNVDLRLSAMFYDTVGHTFPARSIRLLDLLFHDGLRWVSGLLVLVLLVQPRLQPAHSRQWRENLIVVGLAVFSALVVSLMKTQSAHSCPWDLVEFGGVAPYFKLFDSVPSGLAHNPGRCFPSGHASTAFMWIALLYSSLPAVRHHRALILQVFALFAILACGVQLAKGAHFVSHLLATAWVCWAVALIGFWLVRSR